MAASRLHVTACLILKIAKLPHTLGIITENKKAFLESVNLPYEPTSQVFKGIRSSEKLF